MNEIGGLLYTRFIRGTFSSDKPLELAKEVIDSLPTKERCLFAIIHQYAGERLIWGFYFDNKAYGVINVYQHNNTYIRVDIRENEYLLR